MIVLAVVVLRIVWVFPATYLPRWLIPSIRARDPSPPWRYPAFVAWNGMRGAVTIAAALLIPLTTDAGAPFPGRDLIVFFAFAVVLATLVVQGLSLPVVIRALGLEEDDGGAEAEEALARDARRRGGARAARRARGEAWVLDDTAERDPRPVPVPDRPLLGAHRPRRRRQDREAVDEVPAAPPRADRRRAARGGGAAQHRRDQRRGDAPRRARPRPRGSRSARPGGYAGRSPRRAGRPRG